MVESHIQSTLCRGKCEGLMHGYGHCYHPFFKVHPRSTFFMRVLWLLQLHSHQVLVSRGHQIWPQIVLPVVDVLRHILHTRLNTSEHTDCGFSLYAFCLSAAFVRSSGQNSGKHGVVSSSIVSPCLLNLSSQEPIIHMTQVELAHPEGCCNLGRYPDWIRVKLVCGKWKEWTRSGCPAACHPAR